MSIQIKFKQIHNAVQNISQKYIKQIIIILLMGIYENKNVIKKGRIGKKRSNTSQNTIRASKKRSF